MKSERRHELEKNELADRLASGIESTRSFLPIAVGGLVVLAVIAIGWGIYNSSNKRQASMAWTEFYFNLTGGDADSFVELAEDHPRSAVAGWSRQIAGDNYLQRGIDALYRNKSEGKELIGKAIDAFTDVDQAASNPELRSKALLGLAQAHESLGETDKAASFYQQLAKSATQPGLINEANQRLAFLTSDTGKNFYSWFVKLDPKPDAPITLPSDMTLPPMTPDLQFGPSDTELNSSLTPPVPVEVDNSSAPALPAAGQVPAIGQVPKIDDLPLETSPTGDAPAAAESPTPVEPAKVDPTKTDGGQPKASNEIELKP